MIWSRWCLSVVMILLAPLSVLNAGAENFPVKPIILVNCMPAGGGDDRNARAVAAVAANYLGQPLIVQIRGTGSGSIAMQYVKRAKPDGYTLGNCDQGAGSLMPIAQNLPYNPKDFVAIARLAQLNWVLVVRKDSGWNTLADFIKAAKANPGKIIFPIAGIMSADHYPWLLLAKAAGIKGNWVNFRGGGPKLKAMLGKETKVDFHIAPGMAPYVTKKGPFKAIAVASPKRLAEFPNVPTFQELGYDVVSSVWISVFGPKGIPEKRLKILRHAFARIVKDKAYLSLLKNMRQKSGYMPGEQFQKLWRDEYVNVKKLIQDLGNK